MTGLDHESSAAIDEAAHWLRANSDLAERPIIPALRRRFGLTPLDACKAIREANQGGAHVVAS